MLNLTLIISLFCLSLGAPPSPAIAIIGMDAIKPYEALWTATCKVESSNNPFAIGDKHLKQKSYGVAQIRKTRLDDYYKRTGIRYSTKDMFDVSKSKQVFMYYASGDNEVIARTWNGGPDGMKKKSTYKYWKLIKANL